MLNNRTEELAQLMEIAKDLTEKQVKLKAQIDATGNPEMVLLYSKSIRELSKVNRQIAKSVRDLSKRSNARTQPSVSAAHSLA